MQLRALVDADAAVIGAWGLDEEFCAAAEWTPHLPLGHYVDFHRRSIAQPPRDLLRLGAVLEGNLAGYVDLHGHEEGRRELGFALSPALWGRGLGVELARAGLRHGFDVLHLDEVWAEAWDTNQRSVRVLERVGMVFTGLGEAGTYRGAPARRRLYALRRNEAVPHGRTPTAVLGTHT